jgi:hypothetical protein
MCGIDTAVLMSSFNAIEAGSSGAAVWDERITCSGWLSSSAVLHRGLGAPIINGIQRYLFKQIK